MSKTNLQTSILIDYCLKRLSSPLLISPLCPKELLQVRLDDVQNTTAAPDGETAYCSLNKAEEPRISKIEKTINILLPNTSMIVQGK